MIQALKQAALIVATTRVVKLIVVADGDILFGDPSAFYTAFGGSSALNATADVQMAVVNSTVYATDGIVMKALDCTTGAATTFAATAGTAPTGCRLMCNWRGRLVLARQDASPHLIYFSRLGTATDFDYGQTDPAAAIAGNDARAGTIGDIVTALIPASDDVLIVGGDHTLWRYLGDPGAGGQVQPISEGIGILGPNAWCQDSAGQIYFVNTQGLYRLSGNGSIKALSDLRVANYFAAMAKTSQHVSLAWDQGRQGVWIFRQEDDGSTSTHLYYDAKLDAFFPQRTANTDIRPRCALAYDADDPTDRKLIIGGATDKIYFLDDDATSDDGTAISSYVYIGPLMPGGEQGEGIATRIDATIGELPGDSTTVSMLWSLQSGRDPYEAYAHPTISSTPATWQDSGTPTDLGRQTPQCLSQRGRAFFLKVYDNVGEGQTWIYDNASLAFQPGGDSR